MGRFDSREPVADVGLDSGIDRRWSENVGLRPALRAVTAGSDKAATGAWPNRASVALIRWSA